MQSKNALLKSLSSSVSQLVEDREYTPVSFSGGIDSYIAAALVKKYSKPILYTVGNDYSKDATYSVMASKSLGASLNIINLSDSDIIDGIEKTIEILGSNNGLDVLLGSAFYIIAKKINKDGFDICITGQGADELFFGYDKYRRSLEKGEDPNYLRNKDIKELEEILSRREYLIFESMGIKFKSPFLDQEVRKIAIGIDRKYSLKGSDDYLRKHLLREIAYDLGAPIEIVNRRKKALQYGSGILEDIRRIAKERGLNPSLNAYLESIKKE